MVSAGNWHNEALVKENSDIATLLEKKSALTRWFQDEGKLLAPIKFLMTGDLSACMAVFQAYALPAARIESNRE